MTEYTRFKDADGWEAVVSLPTLAREWEFRITQPDGRPAYEFLPGLVLLHDPTFGPHIEDLRRAEDHVNRLLGEAKARVDTR